MPWIEPLPIEQASAPVKDLYDKVRQAYGAVLEPVAIAAHSEPALWAYVAFEREIQKANRLPKKLNYLAILRVAKRIDCSFCVDIGMMHAFEAGVTEAMVTQLDSYRTSTAFTDEERLVLEYCDAMSGAEIDAGTNLQQRLCRHFSTAAIVELTAIIAWEQFRSRFNRALGVEAHGFIVK